MSIFRNKHIVIAAIVAPVLALVAYFGLDTLVGESPHAAIEGQNYSLVEKPNCRYGSGYCGMKNGDFELNLDFEERGADQLLLKLESAFPLDGVMIAVMENEDEDKQPEGMQRDGDDGLHWSLLMTRPDPDRDRLRLVASARQSLYFGDVATKFTRPENASD